MFVWESGLKKTELFFRADLLHSYWCVTGEPSHMTRHANKGHAYPLLTVIRELASGHTRGRAPPGVWVS
jgi:hypothetical protein